MPRFEPRFDDLCPVCKGEVECQGGANLRCRKRDPHVSHLYGILDTYGGLRYIVAHSDAIKHHVRPDELCIRVPRTPVHEPIAWDDIPGVVGKIRWYVGEWIKRNKPNTPHGQEAVRMFKLRQLEQTRFGKSSLDLSAICET